MKKRYINKNNEKHIYFNLNQKETLWRKLIFTIKKNIKIWKLEKIKKRYINKNNEKHIYFNLNQKETLWRKLIFTIKKNIKIWKLEKIN